MENVTVTGMMTSGTVNSTDATTSWASVSPLTPYVDDDKEYVWLIVGCGAAVLTLLIVLVTCIVIKKYCGPTPVKGKKECAGIRCLRSSDQDLFIVSGSNRNSQISGLGSVRASPQEHPINPVCTFDDYVGTSVSATIEQPNSLQPGLVAIDMQPSSYSPAYEGMLDTVTNNDEPEFLQADYASVKPLNKTTVKAVKEDVVFNPKTRKFSLQQAKSSGGQHNKKRNKSTPALPEYNDTDRKTVNMKTETNSTNAVEPNIVRNKQEKGGNRPKCADTKGVDISKVSSLRSVLLEVDAYENIAVINKHNKSNSSVSRMKERYVKAGVNERRALNEQIRAPVPKPRKPMPQKRKTFDPYDYPPGVPIPSAVLEAEETEDSEYIPHEPLAKESNVTKRKTFDPYDYIPGVPISIVFQERINPGNIGMTQVNNGGGVKLQDDAEYVLAESSGVYVAYDPENDEENTVLIDDTRGEYISCNDVFEENECDEEQVSENKNIRQDANNHYDRLTSTDDNNLSPPKPCPGPYYVNEVTDVFHSETADKTDKINESNGEENINSESVIHHQRDKNNVLMNEFRRPSNDKTLNLKPCTRGSDTDISKPRTESARKLSKSEKNIPVAAAKEMRHCQSDDGGIYQNLTPPKPPRLQTSLTESKNISSPERISHNMTTDENDEDSLRCDNNDGLQCDSSRPSDIKDSHEYEDVLVVHKRIEPEKQTEHGYVNIKRFS